MALSGAIRITAFLAAGAGLIAVLAFLPAPEETVFWTSVYDAGHAPLFGLFSLVVLGLGIAVTGWTGRRRRWLYVLALAASAVAGIATELVQFFGPRDADAWDVVRNLAGTIAFLLLAATLDAALVSRTGAAGRRATVWAWIVAAALMLAVSLPIGFTVTAYRARYETFPVLFDFETYLESLFVDTEGAALRYEPLPERFGGVGDTRAARVTFYLYTWPRVYLKEPLPDWTGHRHLAMEIYSGQEAPLTVGVMLDDKLDIDAERPRFRKRLRIEPGANSIRVDLDEIAGQGGRDGVDPSRIRRITIYGIRPERQFTLWLDRIRLE